MERNNEERLFRKLVPTFHPGHAVGKKILTALDLTAEEYSSGTAYRRWCRID